MKSKSSTVYHSSVTWRILKPTLENGKNNDNECYGVSTIDASASISYLFDFISFADIRLHQWRFPENQFALLEIKISHNIRAACRGQNEARALISKWGMLCNTAWCLIDNAKKKFYILLWEYIKFLGTGVSAKVLSLCAMKFLVPLGERSWQNSKFHLEKI